MSSSVPVQIAPPQPQIDLPGEASIRLLSAVHLEPFHIDSTVMATECQKIWIRSRPPVVTVDPDNVACAIGCAVPRHESPFRPEGVR